ncbi:peptide chain release factor N(5)-glutamine methyltransferase [Enterovirga rhinocerotis]|uniref:Release factor glutamine methyltransferase n=1 Tax=Enterovirga rhinocerotis TaxID=1339210 RepID=A0A4V3DZB3_9HYPH|nr:peptide chain release factor N(5)-glutamine methyltransferase [Enterovirga rhinocerotis]TDR95895.1 [protein release factor]-glutamine N5-methyltransferase [Enterovirga rhinocerotis]
MSDRQPAPVPRDLPAGLSWEAALRHVRSALEAAGIDDPVLDARLLVADALGTDAAGLLVRGEDAVDEAGRARLATHLRRRLAREPVGRILGTREFWGLPFRLSPATLEPRPDTETVVEAALARIPDRQAPLRLLDLGTGTGCILVALLSELPCSAGFGIDLSPEAAATARANARRNGVGERAAFLCGCWDAAVRGSFDLVMSNPPYIAEADLGRLAPEVVAYDPVLALDGGGDGLAAYRAILAALPRLLAPGGLAVLEIGWDQADALKALSGETELVVEAVERDLAGRDRAVVLRRRDA